MRRGRIKIEGLAVRSALFYYLFPPKVVWILPANHARISTWISA